MIIALVAYLWSLHKPKEGMGDFVDIVSSLIFLVSIIYAIYQDIALVYFLRH